MESHMTVQEELAIQHMDRSTPFAIRGVSITQLSISRHYGGIKFQGADCCGIR